MVNLYLVPKWFFGYDIAFELAFAVIALVVSIYAFKVYRLSGQRQSRLFAVAFVFVSISYFVQSLLNFVILSKLNENIGRLMRISSISALNALGLYVHIVFLVLGLITLTYMTFKIRSGKTYSLLFLIILVSLLFSSNKLLLFNIIASLLLVYVFVHYLASYLGKRQPKTMLVLVAFAFLLFGHIHFIFAVNQSLFYAIGHIVEFIAYVLILINLVLVVRK